MNYVSDNQQLWILDCSLSWMGLTVNYNSNGQVMLQICLKSYIRNHVLTEQVHQSIYLLLGVSQFRDRVLWHTRPGCQNASTALRFFYFAGKKKREEKGVIKNYLG